MCSIKSNQSFEQRIALSWMVQKETASLHCSGGILADDQVDLLDVLLLYFWTPFGSATANKINYIGLIQNSFAGTGENSVNNCPYT